MSLLDRCPNPLCSAEMRDSFFHTVQNSPSEEREDVRLHRKLYAGVSHGAMHELKWDAIPPEWLV